MNQKKIAMLITFSVLFFLLRATYHVEEEAQETAALLAAEQVDAQVSGQDDEMQDEVLTESKVMPLWGESELPVLYITLDTDDALTDKEFSDATMTMVYPDSILSAVQGEDNFASETNQELPNINDVSLDLEIRYRGNSTYGYDKKPFKIKLESDIDLLRASLDENAESAATDWVLLADWVDRVHLRNYYMYLTAAQLDGIEYVPEGIFVEVYFQGEYQGVYFLSEEIEIDSARLDLDDAYSSDNAVLMEMTHTATQDYYFTSQYEEKTVVYDIHSEIFSAWQVLRAQTIVEDALEAIAVGEQEAVAAIIDLDSCVDMYLLQEFMINVDVGYSSFFLYIKEDEDVLYFGPPWDFDRSIGSAAGVSQYTGLYAAGEDGGHKNQWFCMLMELDWFQDLVRERWNEKKDVFLESFDTVLAIEEQYHDLFFQDYEMWRESELVDGESFEIAYENERLQFYYWMINRYRWFDNYFNEEIQVDVTYDEVSDDGS